RNRADSMVYNEEKLLQENREKVSAQDAQEIESAIEETKRAINAAWTNDLDTQLDYEAMLQTTAGQTRDHREGIAAFLEKRRPNFTGE
ncbi:MAG: enoyl-CoA hydratase-related protein, partial [Phycisphaerales bacterium]|nr:enoyl-CoA hydratase-related protein [Phycisphaerales bacterium]